MTGRWFVITLVNRLCHCDVNSSYLYCQCSTAAKYRPLDRWVKRGQTHLDTEDVRL